MTKLYRIEIDTLWIPPEINHVKRREMVYDFTTGETISNERSWADGQDFFDVNHSPHIYADWDKADAVYNDIEYSYEEWEPLAWLCGEGSNERIESIRMISVDENGDETLEAEDNILELLLMLNATAAKQATVA